MQKPLYVVWLLYNVTYGIFLTADLKKNLLKNSIYMSFLMLVFVNTFHDDFLHVHVICID